MLYTNLFIFKQVFTTHYKFNFLGNTVVIQPTVNTVSSHCYSQESKNYPHL